MIRIEKIKKDIDSRKGVPMKFRFNGSRGQIDEFQGVITDTFNGIFLVKSVEDNRVKSYSYTDILIENLTYEK